ncbi:LysR family transcriptional regulator [Robbsia sp. Bb-Pol-6]|uniref:LysR family transcriptional regulator n=1 Tax=Robbsia betulipollinis TaxID=2981849 RepID=A0ABT3ZJQ8_9BURK|nr:LysR family transcriptional regulator [Robbsia betulipollinis]MCY0386647.1 LysR family transcriptional regulator [Robbsia betulipollinis]
MLHGIALTYFVEVARTGSLAAASETLHVAVSAISRQIAKLERSVGTPLFERLPRGMALTPSGELLAQHARRALLDGDTVLGEIASAQAIGAGMARIGCTEGFTRDFLPRVLATHHAHHPHTRFVLRAGTPQQVEQWVAHGEVDLGLSFSTTSSPLVAVEFSAAAPICALMRADHALAARQVVTLDAVLAYPIAILERGSTVRELMDWCCAIRGRHLEPLLTSNNSSAMHQFATLSGALTLGSRVGLDDIAGASSMVARPIDEPLLMERYVRLSVMKERRLAPTIGALVAALREALTATLAMP